VSTPQEPRDKGADTTSAGLLNFLSTINPTIRHILTLLWFVGLSLIFVAVLLENKIYVPDIHALVVLIKETGIVLFAVVTTSFVYDHYLREHSLNEMKNVLGMMLETKLNDKFDGLIKKTLPEQIDLSVSKHFPKQYTNLKASGIDNAFPLLKTDRLYEEIRKFKEPSEVFMLKMWLSDIERLEVAIREATASGCVFKIALLHPDSVEVFRKRGKFAGMSISSETMKVMVGHSIERMKLLKASLPEKDRDRLMVKLHDDFVSVSIFGFDENILVGFYLHGSIAENNVQLKIRGGYTLYYKAFKSHFKKQWESETNIDLEDYNPQGH
jgi:hypothetical protein